MSIPKMPVDSGLIERIQEMMTKGKPAVFLVQHSYELNEGEDEVKTIGIFKTKASAKRAVEKAKLLPGFKRYPNDFYIDGYELGRLHWADGFVTIRPKKKSAKTRKKKLRKKASRK